MQLPTIDTCSWCLQVVPTCLFTLPGYTDNIGNALLAVPYQIDYLFFRGPSGLNGNDGYGG